MTTQSDEQLRKIAAAIKLAAKSTGTRIDDDVLELWTRELATEDFPIVIQAIRRCYRECKHGRLVLADIVDRLANKPLGPEEAWNMAISMRIYDETVTFVIPTAVLRAFPFDLWNSGDKIAARMAFKERYQTTRLLPEAMDPDVSLGWNREGRETPIREAITSGLLTVSAAHHLLPECNFSNVKQIQ